MEQRDANFSIKKENFAAALAAIKKLANTVQQNGGGGSSTGERWYGWINTDEFVNATTLKDAIAAWRWDVVEDDNGICEIYFNGEKLGDDEYLLDAIAPWVEAGSFVEMSGEDGTLWRWVFNGENCQQKFAKIVWED